MNEESDSFQYDIFSGTPEFSPRWLERVEGRNAAIKRMRAIAAEKPGLYFVFGGRERQTIATADTTKPDS